MTQPPPEPARPETERWHLLSPEAALGKAGSDLGGLSAAEAARRLAADGPNELKEGPRVTALELLLGQFKSLIVWLLIAAGAVSGALGETLDAAAILAIVVLNAAIGFAQEFNAEKSIAALKKMSAPRAKVRRDGRTASVPTADVVVGDVLVLEAGDLVAADARLLEAASLKCGEAALTGESEAADKRPGVLAAAEVPLGDRANMVFRGTSVAAGAGLAVVVAAGMGTELGRIAGLIAEAGADDATPLQKKLDAFGRVLVWASLSVVVLLFALGLWRGTEPFELFMTAVSLAVAAVPEGLPAVVTVALSLGVLRMSRRRALVRRLPAVETLGSTTVICTDKTGTLTVGEMTVQALWAAGRSYEVTGEGYGPEGEVRFRGAKAGGEHAAALRALASALVGCNTARLVREGEVWTAVGDPTEGALLAAAAKAGVDQERAERERPRRGEVPFDSDRKRKSVVRELPDGRLRAYVNGAPDVLLGLCTRLYTAAGTRPLTEADRREAAARIAELAGRGLRVLGSAVRDLDGPASDFTADGVERDLTFVGLAGMHDPPRPEAKEAVARCRAAGIGVVMITGDHPETAAAVAREVGLAGDGDAAVSGTELDRLGEAELRERAPRTVVYARVSAEHKLRIVRAWKAVGAVVAMTGDGVNDAPAIKGADIGVAMGRTGTEVTKQASDMVVTDDNFASIVAAVEEGRGIYDNIRKTLQYLLAGNTGELLLMTVCVAAGLPAPLLPIHLLWINLVTDGLPALCLATDPIDPDVMTRKPRPPSESIADAGFLKTMFFTGALTAAAALAAYLGALRTGTPAEARTQAFAVLVFAELLRAFGARSETKPVWRIPLSTNLNLALVVAASFSLQVWSQHGPAFGRFLKAAHVPWGELPALLALGAVPLAVLEAAKVVRARAGQPSSGRP